MKKLCLFLSVLSLFFAVSCGKDAEKDPYAKEISFYTLQLRPYFTDFINGIIQDFESKYPDVRVNWMDVDQSAYYARLMILVRRGETPDVISTNSELAPLLLGQGHIQPLNDYLDEETLGLYFKDLLETAGMLNGKLHSIPWIHTSGITLFNKDMMDEAGIAEEDYPQNWQEVYNLAPKFKEATGRFLFVPSLQDRLLFLEILVSHGVPLFNEEGAFDFYTPRAVEVLQTLVDLYRQRAIPAQTLITDHRDLNNMFMLEQVAIFPSGPQFIREFRANAPELLDRVVLRGALQNDLGLVNTVPTLISMSSTTQHPEIAVEFITFLTNAENQLEFARQSVVLPSIKDAMEDDFFQKDDGTLESKARIVAARQIAHSASIIPQTTLIGEVADYLHEALHAAFTEEKSPDEALKIAYEKCKQLQQ